MILIPIEKIFSNRDSIRQAREAFLIQKGRTIDPDGLDIREETYCPRRVLAQRGFGPEAKTRGGIIETPA